MAAKQLIPNQHTPLHFIYDKDDCCLCASKFDNDILRMDIDYLLQFVPNDQREEYFDKFPTYYTQEKRDSITNGI